MRFLLSLFFIAAFLAGGYFFWVSKNLAPQKMIFYAPPQRSFWNFQSIDTMKYSRDIAREKLHDESFDAVIEKQVADIASTGATHVAIATPYDEEFVPFLERWVSAAHRHNLHVWFRGNWSGWEGWFDYPRIGRDEHLKKTEAFILKHPDLFEDGDAFSSCPECENGGPGDPRRTGDVVGYRKFLVAEYMMMQQAFRQVHKNVRTNLFSMNGDVARLVMNKETTKSLGGIVTIDHYVKTPEQLARDVDALAKQSGGRIVLGEFGAPILDIHGSLTETEQSAWIEKTLGLLGQSSVVEGVNYWLSVGGSTEIWNEKGKAHQAVGVLKDYFMPNTLYGFVRDELGRPIAGAEVRLGDESVMTDAQGHYILFYSATKKGIATITADGFADRNYRAEADRQEQDVVLVKRDKDWQFRLLQWAR